MNKSKLARDLGIARSSLYYTRKCDALDEEVKRQIEAVMVEHPAYGYKRIARSCRPYVPVLTTTKEPID